MRVVFFSLFFLFLLPKLSFSQADKTFWFAAPDLQQQHGDLPVYLRISTMNSPATVTLSQPANPAFQVQTFNVPANTSQSIDLTGVLVLLENQPANTVLNKGLLIQSTSPITCYYDITNPFNGDIYALKGKNALGQKFTVPMQQSFFSGGIPTYLASIEIVATTDNTSVTILPKNNMVGHVAGVPFTIILNKGQTYSCVAESNDPAIRPGGTIITADKPIAVSTKDDSISYPGYGCLDTAGDQLIPDTLAGKEFVIVSGYLFGPDQYFVFATADATVIKVNGTIVSTINTGEYYTGSINNGAVFIETSQPCQVFHVSGFGCEMGGAILPSLVCTGSTSVSLTRATSQDFYLNIFTDPGSITAFKLNGQTGIINAGQFQPVPGSGGQWVYAKVLLSTAQVPGGSNVLIENNLGKFHVGLIHGDQTSTCRYGFFSDFGNTSLQFTNNSSPYCRGSNVNINAISTGANSFSWQGPNGYSSNNAALILNNLQPAQQGYYILTASGSPCGTVTDSVLIQINVINTTRNISICEGESYEGYSTTGIYIDSFSTTGGCDSIRTLNLAVKPVMRTANTKTICFGQTWEGYNQSGIYIDTFTSTIGCDSIRTLNLIIQPIAYSILNIAVCPGESYMGYSTNGTYVDTIRAADGCISLRTINLSTRTKCDVYFPSAFTPNNDGKNDLFKALTFYKLENFRLSVYNRWGQKVYESTDPSKGWNGKLDGDQTPTATFAWFAEYRIPGEAIIVSRKGLVTLIRK